MEFVRPDRKRFVLPIGTRDVRMTAPPGQPDVVPVDTLVTPAGETVLQLRLEPGELERLRDGEPVAVMLRACPMPPTPGIRVESPEPPVALDLPATRPALSEGLLRQDREDAARVPVAQPVSREGEPAFYALEREARARYEPTVPADMPLGDCLALAEDALGDRWPDARHVRVCVDAGAGYDTGGCRLVSDESGEVVFELVFPPGRRRPWCVLHEVAHVLDYLETGTGGHGPVFAYWCLRLWVARAGWPEGELLALADRHGVALDRELP